MTAVWHTLVGGVVGQLAFKRKAPAPVAPSAVPTVQRRGNTAAADAIAGRRGSRDNRRTGATGAEASAAGAIKTKLGA